MGGMRKWMGKYVTIDPKNPSALGICQHSEAVFNHKDLKKQMEWRGNRLVWTGLMVGEPFLDTPQEQNRPPLVKSDPYAIKNPRPPLDYNAPDQFQAPSAAQIIARLNSFHWGGDE